MFENKKEPQDIFEGVEPPANLPVGESVGSPKMTPPTAVQSAPAPSAPVPVTRAPVAAAPLFKHDEPVSEGKIIANRHTGTGGHLWKTIVIVVIAFIAMGLAAYLAYTFMNPKSEKVVETPDGQTAGQNDENAVIPDGKGDTEDAPDVPDVQIIIDTDGDGLTNDEEKSAGTNVAKPDTDNDLLGDREEVQVYGTDPLRADTDDDGYTDGQEVRSGYNPNGPGKILEIPSAQ
jgi:hypothetical protein